MKYRIGLICCLLLLLVLAACKRTQPEMTDFEKINGSTAAIMELPDGTWFLNQNLHNSRLDELTALPIHEASFEPADGPEDWLYRIVYNPSIGRSVPTEVTVTFHEKYVQIGPEFYLVDNSYDYEQTVLDWVKKRFEYSFSEYDQSPENSGKGDWRKTLNPDTPSK